MKRAYRNLLLSSLGTLVCLFLALPANAQHHGGGHGGGGGRASGGGGGHVSYSGGGGRTSFSGGSRANVSRGNVRSNVRVNGNYRGGRVGYGGRAGVNTYRGRVGYAGRGYGGRGRVGYGGRGYGGRGGWFGHGGWYYHGGFFGSIYGPRLGFSIGFLPYGYYSFYWGDMPYFYSGGYFYQYDNDQYTVVQPPVGAEVNALPRNAQSIVINGQQYYEVNGVYYVAITKDDGSLAYQVAGKDGELNTGDDQGAAPDQGGQGDQGYAPAPNNQQYGNPAPQDNAPQNVQSDGSGPQVGDLVAELPRGTRRMTIDGKKLYVSPDDVYYQETRDNNNQKAYKIVGLPSEDNDQ